MIQSMTAFARTEHQGEWGSAICEIRSVNHRYLELGIRLPETLLALEAPLRERIRHYIRRGKIECTIRFQSSTLAAPVITINYPLAEALCKANEAIANLLDKPAPVNPMDILRWPQLLQMTDMDLDSVQDKIIHLLEKALQELVDARLREGEELRQAFLQRLDVMKTELSNIRHRLPTIYQQQRSRLIARFNDANIELESNRFEQEMVLFAQKMDVSEEMERLDAHISEVRRILKHGGVAGRRLDFLMQELNREANTLGAKSVDVDTTRASVELKVLIEQMREQVQNVE